MTVEGFFHLSSKDSDDKEKTANSVGKAVKALRVGEGAKRLGVRQQRCARWKSSGLPNPHVAKVGIGFVPTTICEFCSAPYICAGYKD
jgi:hypothetical protein